MKNASAPEIQPGRKNLTTAGLTGSNRWTCVIEVPEGSTYYTPAALAVGVDGIVYFRQYQMRGFTPSSTLMALSGPTDAPPSLAFLP